MTPKVPPQRHPKEVLAEQGAAVKKSFGQNFLVDMHHIDGIASQVKSLSARDDGLVFEIGSGLGALTRALLQKGLLVHAVERDRDMARIMREELAEPLQSGALVLHEDNATTFDYLACAGLKPFVLCGNLPYHLTSTLIFRALEMGPQMKAGLFMIQREVAERIVSAPGSRDYGILSVLVQALFHVSITQQVPSGAFWPRPQVDSAVIALTPRAKAILAPSEFEPLKALVKAAFSQRRKTLRNALKGVVDFNALGEKSPVAPDARPETLSPEQFIELMRVSAA